MKPVGLRGWLIVLCLGLSVAAAPLFAQLASMCACSADADHSCCKPIEPVRSCCETQPVDHECDCALTELPKQEKAVPAHKASEPAVQAEPARFDAPIVSAQPLVSQDVEARDCSPPRTGPCRAPPHSCL